MYEFLVGSGLKGQKGEEAGMSLGVVAGRAWCYAQILNWLLAGCYFLFISGRKKLVWYAGQRAQVRVAVRVDSSSSGIRDGLGVGVCI
jgi:hypothetical protein